MDEAEIEKEKRIQATIEQIRNASPRFSTSEFILPIYVTNRTTDPINMKVLRAHLVSLLAASIDCKLCKIRCITYITIILSSYKTVMNDVAAVDV